MEGTLREALDALDDSISIYEADGSHVYSSRSARRRFANFFAALDAGMSHWDALAEATRKRLPDLDPERVAAYVAWSRHKFETGETYPLLTDDGREVMITYRTLSNGRKTGISVDVTDLKNKERALEQARAQAEAGSAAKSAFVANMSHEIRTPLNGVLGMASALKQDDLTESQLSKVDIMIESGHTLLAVLNDILDLSKIEAGRVEISPANVQIRAGIRHLLKLYQPKADEKGLKLSLSFDIDVPENLRFDPVRARQCLTNLLSNAIKFTETGEVAVSIRTIAKGGRQWMKISVRDTGIGMSQEQVDRLFADFAQADETITRRFGGTGLGLAISRRLARLMGGDITVTSEIGKGSQFVLTFEVADALPGNDAPEAVTPTEGENRVDLQGRRVLLTDDNAINRMIAKLFMKPFGLVVVEAENGAQALEKLEQEPFDLVLMDVHMPVMDGREAVARIRASGQPWSDIPVIALTADAMDGDREKFLAAGMDGYLSKPLEQRELFTAMNAVLHGQRGYRRAA